MQATAPIEGVGLDQYIRAKARLEHDPHALDAVIELLSLPDAEAWRRVDGGWRERMEKNERLARVVGEFLDDYIHELRGVRAAAEGEAEDDEAEDAPAPEPARREVPSYMQAQVSAGVAVPPAAVGAPAPLPHQAAPGYAMDLDTTQPPLGRPNGPALPFERAAGEPAPLRLASANPGSQTSNPAMPDGAGRPHAFNTEAIDLAALQRALNPFRDPTATASSAPFAATSGDDGDQTAFIPRHLIIDATATPPSSPLGPSPVSSSPDVTQPPLPRQGGEALPFNSHGATPSLSADAAVPARANPFVISAEGASGDETAGLDFRMLREAVLPFREGTSDEQPALSPSAKGAFPRDPGSPGTEELARDLFAAVAAKMPFAPRATPEASAPEGAGGQPEIVQPASLDQGRPGGSPAVEPMSLERYVAISAELATGEQGEVLARLGVTRDAWVGAMHEMAKRFKSESGLEARYRALMRQRLGHGRTPPTT